MNPYGIILAGVHRWDESAFAQIYPRVLWPIMGRPLIQHMLHWLQGAGIRQVTLCANSDTGMLRKQLDNGSVGGVRIAYYEDHMPRGPAGCMREAALRSDSELFLVMGPCLPVGIDPQQIIRAHIESQASLTIVVSKVATSNGDANGVLEPVDLYCVSRSAIEEVQAHIYQDMKEVLIPRLYRCGKHVVPYVVQDRAIQRIDDSNTYLEVGANVLRRAVQAQAWFEGYHLIGEALIHESANIHPRARLVGHVMVGSHSTISRGATVVGPTTIGTACIVEPHAIVSRSVLWAHCRVGQGAILDHCVLTEDAHVESTLVVRDTVWMSARPTPSRGRETNRSEEVPKQLLIGVAS